jgi:hypothetical protein
MDGLRIESVPPSEAATSYPLNTTPASRQDPRHLPQLPLLSNLSHTLAAVTA